MVLKIKDWILTKNGAQFKINIIGVDGTVYSVTRISDGFIFDLGCPYIYKNNGNWVFRISYFLSDKIHVHFEVCRLDGSNKRAMTCEINDIKVRYSKGLGFTEITSFLDKTPTHKPRRRIAAKK